MDAQTPGEARLQRMAEPEGAVAAETRTLVIGPYQTRRAAHGRPGESRAAEARLDEAVGLAAAIELDVVDRLGVSLSDIRPIDYLGKGRVEEIAGRIAAERSASW